MTFWLDAHLHPELAAWLGSRFKITVKPLKEIGLHEAKDPVLIAAAERFGEIVILTKDVEFADQVRRRNDPSPRLILLRCGNLTAHETQMWLSRVFDEALAHLAGGAKVVELQGPGN